MVFESEKILSDSGDKISEEDKKALKEKVDALKEALKGQDIQTIKDRQDELQKQFYSVSEKLYKQNAAQNGANGGQGGPQGAQGFDSNNFNPNGANGNQNGSDGYYEAPYTDVDDNK